MGGSAYLYFNITGNAWPFAVEKGSFSVVSTESGPVLETSRAECFTGAFGQATGCTLVDEVKSAALYKASFTQSLFPGQGITLRLPLTFASSPFPAGGGTLFLLNYWDALLFSLLSLLTILAALFLYRKYGKDPDDGRPIVTEFTPPKNISLLEASYILYEKIEPKAIGAQLIEEARIGNLSIKAEEEEHLFGMIKKITFTLHVIKESSDKVSRDLLSFLSGRVKTLKQPLTGNGGAYSSPSLIEAFAYAFSAKELEELPEGVTEGDIDLSKAKLNRNQFSHLRLNVEKSLFEKLLFDRMVSLLVRKEAGRHLKILLYTSPPVAIFIALFFSNLDGFGAIYAYSFIFIFVVSLLALIRSLNRKTLYGVDVKYYLLGLKRYIEVAEEERIAFHNQPSKTPQFYLELLPWAMLFGLEKKWSKEFEGVSFTKDDVNFYHSNAPFVAAGFASSLGSSMGSFGTVAAQAASVASSGGGGGGSSGGGGGGGGGSW